MWLRKSKRLNDATGQSCSTTLIFFLGLRPLTLRLQFIKWKYCLLKHPNEESDFDPNLWRIFYLSSSEQIHPMRTFNIQHKHITVKPILDSPERLSTPPFGLWLCPVLESGRAGKLSFIYQKEELRLEISSLSEVMSTLTTRRMTRARNRARPEM